MPSAAEDDIVGFPFTNTRICPPRRISLLGRILFMQILDTCHSALIDSSLLFQSTWKYVQEFRAGLIQPWLHKAFAAFQQFSNEILEL